MVASRHLPAKWRCGPAPCRPLPPPAAHVSNNSHITWPGEQTKGPIQLSLFIEVLPSEAHVRAVMTTLCTRAGPGRIGLRSEGATPRHAASSPNHPPFSISELFIDHHMQRSEGLLSLSSALPCSARLVGLSTGSPQPGPP